MWATEIRKANRAAVHGERGIAHQRRILKREVAGGIECRRLSVAREFAVEDQVLAVGHFD